MTATTRQRLSVLDTLDDGGATCEPEERVMEGRGGTRHGRRHRSHHTGRGRPGYEDDPFDLEPDDYETIDERRAAMTDEERSLEDARIAAEKRAELLLRAGKMGVVVLLLLFFLTPVGVIALIYWCMKFGRRLYRLLVEPRMRERLIEEEMSRHIHANVGRERQEIAGEHQQTLEVLSAQIAHEIRNPITAAKSLLQQMREDPESFDNEEYAQVALGELERVERSISHLLRFGRDEEFNRVTVLMRDILDSALETFRDRSEREGVEITREFDSDGLLEGDAEKLRRVMINLVSNAFDALADGKPDAPEVSVSMGENLAGTEVWVRVRDNGNGIDAETRARMFTPFFTAKQGGTGLGLAITKKLVDAHRGSIEVDAAPGGGAEFIVRFPKQANGATS
jgi:signal transduction histidine kinase